MRISDWSSDVCSSDLDSTAYASFSRATTGSLWLQVSRLTRTPRTPDAYMLASSAGEVALSITTTPRTLSPRYFMASSKPRLSEPSAPGWTITTLSSEERRGGEEWFGTGSSRRLPYHYKQNNSQT